jgi:hypothetical protein
MVQYTCSILRVEILHFEQNLTPLPFFRISKNVKKLCKSFDCWHSHFYCYHIKKDVQPKALARIAVITPYHGYQSCSYLKEKKLMVCPQCGKDVLGNATFCSYCGSVITQQPQLNTQRAENTQYGYEGNTPPPPPEYMQNPYTYTPTPNPAQPPNMQNPYPYMPDITPTPAQPPNMQNPYPYMSAPSPAQPPNMQAPYPYMPAPSQTPKRKKGAVFAIVSAVVVLILLSSIIGFAVYKQQSAAHAAATSTAAAGTARAQVTGTANAQATGTVVAQASATAQARANPYSSTMPTLNAITLTSQQDAANWDSNASCTYNQGYVISTTNGQLDSCNYNNTLGADYTAEVSVTINNTNSQAGMILRQTTNSLEILYIEKGQLTLQLFDNVNKVNVIIKTASAPITPNVSVLVAVVVDHGVLKAFVNHTDALTIDDSRADIAQSSSFALMEGSTNTVASSSLYSNLRLWTA